MGDICNFCKNDGRLFVTHSYRFSVKVMPYSAHLYFVSNMQVTLPESVFEDPPELNSTPVAVLVLTSNFKRLKNKSINVVLQKTSEYKNVVETFGDSLKPCNLSEITFFSLC